MRNSPRIASSPALPLADNFVVAADGGSRSRALAGLVRLLKHLSRQEERLPRSSTPVESELT